MLITDITGTQHGFRNISTIVRRGSQIEGAEVLEIVTTDNVLHELTVTSREAQRSEARAWHLFPSLHHP